MRREGLNGLGSTLLADRFDSEFERVAFLEIRAPQLRLARDAVHNFPTHAGLIIACQIERHGVRGVE